jgi:hypothetical protein
MVRKVYVGSGRLAGLWAKADRAQRQRQEADRNREQEVGARGPRGPRLTRPGSRGGRGCDGISPLRARGRRIP